MEKEKAYVHIVSNGKLIGIEYGYPDEIIESLPELREKVAEIKENRKVDCEKPDGYHAIFSKDKSGCCIYCGKPIA